MGLVGGSGTRPSCTAGVSVDENCLAADVVSRPKVHDGGSLAGNESAIVSSIVSHPGSATCVDGGRITRGVLRPSLTREISDCALPQEMFAPLFGLDDGQLLARPQEP